MTWESIAQAKREAVFSKIPKEWVIVVDRDSIETTVIEYLDSVLPEDENAITDSTVLGLLEKLKTGELTAMAITKAFCHRAALSHQLLNNCSEIFFEKAFVRAEELDTYFKQTGELKGKLHGIPISLKDQVNLEGLDTGLGFISNLNKPKTKEDESVIAKILYNEGAVFYVKTTTPMAMMAGDTYSNIYGQTYNPWSFKLSPGGSSGGEGSLIASKASMIGLSTDLGGSIRIPAAFNGLFALRPSWHRLPYAKVDNSMAHQPITPSVIGPSARSLEDIEYFVKLVIEAEPWMEDPKAVPIPWREYAVPEKLCFGLYKTNKMRTPHPPLLRAMELAKEKLVAMGHEVIEWEPPVSHKFMRDSLAEIFYSERFQEIKDECAKSGEPMIPQIVDRGDPDSSPLTVPEHWEQAKRQNETQLEYFKYWRDTVKSTTTGRPVDAWLTPIWDAISMPVGDPRYDLTSSYTYSVNYLNLTSTVVPITNADKEVDTAVDPSTFKGFDEEDAELQKLYDPEVYDGMPACIQVICNRYEEEKCLAMGKVVYKATH